MNEKRIIRTPDEEDAYTGWRRLMTRFQKAGKVKRIKRRTHKAERRRGKHAITEYDVEADDAYEEDDHVCCEHE